MPSPTFPLNLSGSTDGLGRASRPPLGPGSPSSEPFAVFLSPHQHMRHEGGELRSLHPQRQAQCLAREQMLKRFWNE